MINFYISKFNLLIIHKQLIQSYKAVHEFKSLVGFTFFIFLLLLVSLFQLLFHSAYRLNNIRENNYSLDAFYNISSRVSFKSSKSLSVLKYPTEKRTVPAGVVPICLCAKGAQCIPMRTETLCSSRKIPMS